MLRREEGQGSLNGDLELMRRSVQLLRDSCSTDNNKLPTQQWGVFWGIFTIVNFFLAPNFCVRHGKKRCWSGSCVRLTHASVPSSCSFVAAHLGKFILGDRRRRRCARNESNYRGKRRLDESQTDIRSQGPQRYLQPSLVYSFIIFRSMVQPCMWSIMQQQTLCSLHSSTCTQLLALPLPALSYTVRLPGVRLTKITRD